MVGVQAQGFSVLQADVGVPVRPKLLEESMEARMEAMPTILVMQVKI